MKLTGKYFKIFSSYLHRDLLQDISCMSLEGKIYGDIQKYTIINNNIYLANTLLDTDRAVNDNLNVKIKSNIILLSKYFRIAMNKISRKVLKRDIFRTQLRHNYPDWLRKYHKKFILDTVSYEKMVTKNIFKKQELEKIVDLYLKGDNSLAQFISNLISLELWLKKFSKKEKIILKR